jgi:hypothetical protein
VEQTGIVSFVVDQLVMYRVVVKRSSCALAQLAVSCGLKFDGGRSPNFTDEKKEIFSFELFETTCCSSHLAFTAFQKAMANQFEDLRDRLRLNSLLFLLTSNLSSSMTNESGVLLSLIQVKDLLTSLLIITTRLIDFVQRSADKCCFDLLCTDGLAALSSIADDTCLIHAVRITCDWLPEVPNLQDASSRLFSSIECRSASRIFASVIHSQIKTKLQLPSWCMTLIASVLYDSLMSPTLTSTGQFHDFLRTHFMLKFSEWGLQLPPADARARVRASFPVWCSPDCTSSHERDAACLLCDNEWDRHNDHICPVDGRRGSFLISVSADKTSSTGRACTCSVHQSSILGLSEFVFSGHAGGSVSQSSKGSIEVNSSDKVQFSSVAESDRQKLFEEFQEWLRNKELSSQVKPSQLQASDSICKECPVCFHDGVAVFGLPESSGVFPGCTVSIKETWMLTVSQSPFSPVLRPGETGFVLCTYKDLALVQGPDILGVMSCKSLQLISCVVSLLFCASSLKNSLNECVLFSEVMSNVAKRCTRQGSLALQNSLSTSSVFLIQNFFSVFDREYVDSFEFPIQFQLDLIFLCHSASTFTNSFKHVLQSFFPSVEDLSKMVRFLFAFGSVHWEKAVPHFSFFSFASGICQVKQHIQEHFFEILFPCNRSSFQNGVVLYNLISSLSSAEVSYFAHLLRHSALPLNFFIPFVHYIASGILSGNVNGDKSHCIILFLQNCIPPGAFLQLRYALVHLFSRLPNQFHCRRNINEIHVTTIPRWIIDLLAPNLGAPCTAIVNGEMQSILPQCGWCVIAVAGHPALRLPLHEGMVLDSIYCAQVPVSHVTVCARLPFQEHFVLDAIESLLSKQLISKTNSTIPQYYFSSNSSLIPSPCFASHQTFNCIGDMYCQAVHAVFSLFKRSPVLLEGDLFLKLCRKSDEVEICFSCSYIAFVLSKILASGKIVRRGQWLSSAENSLHVHNSPFKPFEVRLTEASCIKSMVIFACDEAAALPSLHLSTAGACESYVYEDALSLVRESFSRIHQVTGIDLGEISDCFNFCKGRLIDTVHELMFSPKFSSKRTKDQTSSDASFARCIRFVEEGFCPTCLSDKILVALPCDHRYCQECLQLYIQDSMANSSTPKAAAGADRAGGRLVTNISCPSHIQGCSYMISSSDVKFVATNEHSSFIDLICRQATRTMASGSYSTATCACGRLIMGETNECEYECLCGRIASVGDSSEFVRTRRAMERIHSTRQRGSSDLTAHKKVSFLRHTDNEVRLSRHCHLQSIGQVPQ